MTGFSIETERSIAKTEPEGLSIVDSPIGPESVKKRTLFEEERHIEFGPFRGVPSKSLMTGAISILSSRVVLLKIA